VLVVCDETKDTTLYRAVVFVAAMLITKLKVPLDIILNKLNERCYFYTYEDALRKSEYIQEREKHTKFSREFELLVSDTNTSPKYRKAKSWKPGIKRCEITDPAYEKGLYLLERQVQTRHLQKMRRKSVKFTSEFITLLNQQ